MKQTSKEMVLDLLFRELEEELKFDTDSIQTTNLLDTIKDFINSYTRGIDQMTNRIMLLDLLKEYKEGEKC